MVGVLVAHGFFAFHSRDVVMGCCGAEGCREFSSADSVSGQLWFLIWFRLSGRGSGGAWALDSRVKVHVL